LGEEALEGLRALRLVLRRVSRWEVEPQQGELIFGWGLEVPQALGLPVLSLTVGLEFEAPSIFPVLKPVTLRQKWLLVAERLKEL
jgi:hypothetical protein